VMVAGFMASLNVAVTMVFGQAPKVAFGGTAEVTVGEVKPLIAPPFLSGSLQPVLNTHSNTVMKQIVEVEFFRMNLILFLQCSCIAGLA